MTRSFPFYRRLSALAGLILLLLVMMQVYWLTKAASLQKEETTQSLRRLVPELALAVNRLDHRQFHGDTLRADRWDLAAITQCIDSMLRLHGLAQPASYFALYQSDPDGVFVSHHPEAEAALRQSDIRACLSCIVSIAIETPTERRPSESDEAYQRRRFDQAAFQYFSPMDRNRQPPDQVLWLALYQPQGFSHALRTLTYLFVGNVLLLLLLLGLFFYLIRSLARHKRLTQVKEDFFSNMTHEFKTPLSSIRLASRVLRQSQDPHKNLSYHQLIEKESLLLERQIDKLLDLSLLDHGGLTLAREAVDLGALLRTIPRRLAPLIEARQAHLHLHAPAQMLLTGDRDHLLSSLCNLVENSLKYSPMGVNIWLTAAQQGAQVTVRVRDDGPGIPVKDQGQVFDRFYRAQGRDQYQGKGFGIGLSYVQSIVEAHGGRIILRSTPPHGCEFILYL